VTVREWLDLAAILATPLFAFIASWWAITLRLQRLNDLLSFHVGQFRRLESEIRYLHRRIDYMRYDRAEPERD
jgi:hypothetical protein